MHRGKITENKKGVYAMPIERLKIIWPCLFLLMQTELVVLSLVSVL